MRAERPLVGVLARAVATYLGWCERRGGSIVLAALLCAALGLGAASQRIGVNPSLDALLPQDTPAARGNVEARERFAATSPYYLVVQSSDPALNRRLIAQVLREVRRWDETLWAIQMRDPSYFLDRRLLYVDAARLKQLADEVEIYLDWHSCEHMPGCINFEDEPAEPDWAALRDHYRSLPELQALFSLFGGERSLDQATQQPGQDAARAQERQGRLGELCGKDGRVCVVQAALRGDAGDLAYASRMLKRGEALLESLRPPDAPEDLELAVTGVYRNLPSSRDSVLLDLSKTFGLSLALVLGLLLLQFRGLRVLLMLVVPLLVGLGWTLGLVAVPGVELNLISSAVLVVLAGLGIDFGLHLLTHYGAHRERGAPPRAALDASLTHLAPSLLVAAFTTACGFLALSFAHFPGFAQLGYLAAIGIIVTLLSAVIVTPALVLWLHRLRPLGHSLTRPLPLPPLWERPWRRPWALGVCLAGVIMFVIAALLTQRLKLEYDFSRLEAKAAHHGTDYGPALHGMSRSMVLMLADEPAELERAARGVRALFPDGLKGNEGPSVITPGVFIPPDQEARLEQVRRLRRLVDKAKQRAPAELQRRLERWSPLLAADSTIDARTLPDWVIDAFAERSGRFGTVGVIYTNFVGRDGHQMIALDERLDTLRERFPKVRFASGPAVLGEVMPLLEADGARVTLLALLGSLVATLLIGRSLLRTSLVLIPVVVAVTLSAAFMVLAGWKLNLYNMLVFPVAFGIGVDGAIYVVWTALRRASPAEAAPRLDAGSGSRVETGAAGFADASTSVRAVIGSTLTTLVAFGSLMASNNGGLRSVGVLAVVALAATLLTNLIWLPAVLSLLRGGEVRAPRT